MLAQRTLTDWLAVAAIAFASLLATSGCDHPCCGPRHIRRGFGGYGLPSCYGFSPTCWRGWPDECVQCPPPTPTPTFVAPDADHPPAPNPTMMVPPGLPPNPYNVAPPPRLDQPVQPGLPTPPPNRP